MLDRLHGRVADLPYEDLRRPLTQLRRIDGDGGESQLSVARVRHVIEANNREILTSLEPVQHEPIQHAERYHIVEAERRRWRVPGRQNLSSAARPPSRLGGASTTTVASTDRPAARRAAA